MIKKSMILLGATFALSWFLVMPGRTSPPQAGLVTPVYLPLALCDSAVQPSRTPTATRTRLPSGTPTVTRTPTRTEEPAVTATSTPTPTGTNDPAATVTPTPTSTATPDGQSAIIVDHTDTNISLIPEYWIAQAKLFVVHYAHTSHGSQVLTGLQWLEAHDARFNVDIEASGTVVLPDDTTALRLYDGNNYPGNTYITPDMYWESADGINHTRSVADTGWFDLSTWTWCGQASSYSEAQIQTYLDVLAGLETEYPGMRYIYYTGHSDGTAPGSTLWRNNNMIRQYVLDNQKVLFDFNDMEVYAPDGSGPYYNDDQGYCEWCAAWCTAHPTAFECQDLPGCAHTHGLFCTLKGQAFWVLMARLAGWDGNP